MEDRAYLSIGEVLSLLKEEFPDVTISKIRFLESQGLLDPERTPSGYRKFYDTDVDRLRWILRQQRENFLPLKVIKGRLRDAVGEPLDEEEAPAMASGSGRSSPGNHASPPAATPHPDPRADPRASGLGAGPGAGVAEPPPLTVPRTGASLTLTELAIATGLEEDDLRELERFGLLSPRRVGSGVYYDEDSMVVANLAAGFMRYGVEARHLRMYKVAAEREASFFEQVVMPMLKQRNPQARRQATETLTDLSRLGQSLRAAMLRQALRQYLEGQ
ncbi:MAG: MerR family transcriptional regulator [Actinomycetota bacterium]|nr:MerR family transcriptional regulator [Actinomycetota bacterium]